MKNRDSVYLVVRKVVDEFFNEQDVDSHCVGVYETLQRAEEIKDAYTQQVIEGNIPTGFSFEVQIATWYAE